jgi:arylsulfatase A-like enzyme
VRNLDIAPTLLDLARVPVPPSFEGRSLLPLILDSEPDGSTPPHRPSFAALGTPLFPGAAVQESVDDGNWSYARNVELDPEASEFLFDGQVDPDAQVNLIEFEASQGERLARLLEEHRSRRPERDVRSRGVAIDPAIAERLRAMGYLE